MLASYPAPVAPMERPSMSALAGSVPAVSQASTTNAPPTLREILEVFGKDGGGDRELLMAILGAKRAEEERLASQLSYQAQVHFLAQQAQLQQQQQHHLQQRLPSMNGPPSPPLSNRSSSSASSSHHLAPPPMPSSSSSSSHSSPSSPAASASSPPRYEPYPAARNGKLSQVAESIRRRRASPPSPRSNPLPSPPLSVAPVAVVAPALPPPPPAMAIRRLSPPMSAAGGGLPSIRSSGARSSLTGSPPMARESFLRGGSSDEGEPELDVVGR